MKLLYRSCCCKSPILWACVIFQHFLYNFFEIFQNSNEFIEKFVKNNEDWYPTLGIENLWVLSFKGFDSPWTVLFGHCSSSRICQKYNSFQHYCHQRSGNLPLITSMSWFWLNIIVLLIMKEISVIFFEEINLLSDITRGCLGFKLPDKFQRKSKRAPLWAKYPQMWR